MKTITRTEFQEKYGIENMGAAQNTLLETLWTYYNTGMQMPSIESVKQLLESVK